MNLLSNAADAVSAPDGLVEVTIRREWATVVVEVADNGPGIDPALANRFRGDGPGGRRRLVQQWAQGRRHGGVAKAYPYQILIWHEIVNDEVGGLGLAVTYCPGCPREVRRSNFPVPAPTGTPRNPAPARCDPPEDRHRDHPPHAGGSPGGRVGSPADSTPASFDAGPSGAGASGPGASGAGGFNPGTTR